MDDVYIKKVCNGDRDAFRYLVNKYKDMAYSIALSVVKEEYAAQEIMQEAFVKAYRNLSSFSHQSRFSTWFYRIVTNEALLYLKKQKKELISFTEVYTDEPADESFLTGLAKEEQAYLINEALQKLSPKESLALRLFYLEEENIKEVCEITGWTEANTKVILHRARKNIFALLTQLMKTLT